MFLTFLTFFNWGVSIGIVQLELSNENNAFRTQSCQLPQVNEVLTTYIYIINYNYIYETDLPTRSSCFSAPHMWEYEYMTRTRHERKIRLSRSTSEDDGEDMPVSPKRYREVYADDFINQDSVQCNMRA